MRSIARAATAVKLYSPFRKVYAPDLVTVATPFRYPPVEFGHTMAPCPFGMARQEGILPPCGTTRNVSRWPVRTPYDEQREHAHIVRRDTASLQPWLPTLVKGLLRFGTHGGLTWLGLLETMPLLCPVGTRAGLTGGSGRCGRIAQG